MRKGVHVRDALAVQENENARRGDSVLPLTIGLPFIFYWGLDVSGR